MIYQYVLHRVYQQADNIVSLWVVSGFLKKQKRIRKNTKYKNSNSESTKEYKPAKELWKWNKIFLKKKCLQYLPGQRKCYLSADKMGKTHVMSPESLTCTMTAHTWQPWLAPWSRDHQLGDLIGHCWESDSFFGYCPDGQTTHGGIGSFHMSADTGLGCLMLS